MELSSAVSLLGLPRDMSSSETSTLPTIQLVVLPLGQAQGPSLSLALSNPLLVAMKDRVQE